MEKIRLNTASITLGGRTMIFDPLDTTIEIWNFEQKERLMTFKRPYGNLFPGFGMYLIEKDFCN